MDFSNYFKRNGMQHRKYSVEKKCLNCGKVITKEEHYPYYPQFCSQRCKEKYIGVPLD